MRWKGHVVRVREKKNAYSLLLEKTRGKEADRKTKM
jgi:hypothetical protein